MATVRIQLRRGTEAQWDSANPILAAGEVGIETDTNTFKFGDGVTAWNSLDYALSDTVDDYIPLSEKGVANGVATLDGSGKVPYAQIPSIDELSQDAVNTALVAGTGITKVYNDGANTITVAVDTSVIATKAELAEVSQDSINDALVAGTGLDKTYDDVNNLITIDIDSTVATLTGTQTLTNKTLTSPVINTPTGIVQADVGLGNVDNTSDVNKPVSTAQAAADSAVASAAASALSSHESDTTNIHGIADTSILVTTTGVQNLSNKTLVSPIISSPIVNGNASFEGDIIIEGTANDFETTLSADPTSDRSIVFPDKSGTVSLTSDLNAYATLSGATFTGAVNGTDLTLSGNLTVNGTTTNINTTNLVVEDKNVVLGDTASPSDASADGGGISLKGTTDKSLNWVDATDSWTSSENFDLASGKNYKVNGTTVLTSTEVLGKSVPSGTILGTSDAQTLTNKTIALGSNTISGTLAQFNTAVTDADLVSLAGVETLTNKTLTSPVINGPTGLNKNDVGLSNVDNIADANKPVSTATQTALDLKANLASPTFTGTVVLPSTTSIGTVSSAELATLDGVTSAIQTQLDAKLASATASSTYAPIASPTFTGTVSGISKSMVGLANVDNTADTNKPVSSATQTALDLKANLASPTFTGTVVLPSTTSIGLVSATEIGYVDGVTSGIQAQLDSKLASATAASTYAPLASPTFTGTVTLPAGTVTSGMILDGTIVDGDVNASAAIAQSKISGLTSDLAAKAPSASPTFTGTPAAPTAVAGTNTTQVATTAFVKTAVDNVIASAPGALDTLNELAAALGNDANYAATMTSALALKAPLASPTFTGTVTLPTGTVTSGMILDGTIVDGDINASAAIAQSKISGLTSDLALKAPLASPTFTGTVTVAASGVAFTDGTQTKEGVPSRTTINSATAAYNLSTGGLTLRDTLIECNSASAFTVTIPANATTAYPIGTSIDLLQTGAGQVTVAGAAGVTVNGTPGLKLRTQWSSATLFKRNTDTWVIMGDLTA